MTVAVTNTKVTEVQVKASVDVKVKNVVWQEVPAVLEQCRGLLISF